jgi:hypothetical protein
MDAMRIEQHQQRVAFTPWKGQMGIARKPVLDVKAGVAVQVCIGDGL